MSPLSWGILNAGGTGCVLYLVKQFSCVKLAAWPFKAGVIPTNFHCGVKPSSAEAARDERRCRGTFISGEE